MKVKSKKIASATVPPPAEPAPTGVFEAPNSPSELEHFKELGEDYMKKDLNSCQQLLDNFTAGEKQISSTIQEILTFTEDESISFNSGISYYSCKNLIFNEYMICLKFYELFRLSGISFTEGVGLDLYKRLVYAKTLFLKLAPVEKKLEYQKNKLLKRGEKISIESFQKQKEPHDEGEDEEPEEFKQQSEELEQESEEDDNLMFRPQVKNLVKAEKLKASKGSDKYVPVKQTAVLPADEKEKRRQSRQTDRKKAFLLRKFRGDIDSGDEAEERGILNEMDERMKKKFEEKTRLEEENFTRFGDSKKEKYWRKQMMKNQFRGNQLNDELKEVAMIRELVEEEGQGKSRPFEREGGPKPAKKRKPN